MGILTLAIFLPIVSGLLLLAMGRDENAKAGAIPLGMPFPSGDLWPPAHPGGCRCATVPGPS